MFHYRMMNHIPIVNGVQNYLRSEIISSHFVRNPLVHLHEIAKEDSSFEKLFSATPPQPKSFFSISIKIEAEAGLPKPVSQHSSLLWQFREGEPGDSPQK